MDGLMDEGTEDRTRISHLAVCGKLLNNMQNHGPPSSNKPGISFKQVQYTKL